MPGVLALHVADLANTNESLHGASYIAEFHSLPVTFTAMTREDLIVIDEVFDRDARAGDINDELYNPAPTVPEEIPNTGVSMCYGLSHYLSRFAGQNQLPVGTKKT